MTVKKFCNFGILEFWKNFRKNLKKIGKAKSTSQKKRNNLINMITDAFQQLFVPASESDLRHPNDLRNILLRDLFVI